MNEALGVGIGLVHLSVKQSDNPTRVPSMHSNYCSMPVSILIDLNTNFYP